MYENMLCLEDFNSILAFNPDFTEQYVIDCSLLPQVAFSDTYYDFNIISMVDNADGTFTYKLEVYNKMWDGGITFKRIPDGSDEPLVNTILSKNYNNEYYMLNITTTYTDFDIVLSLNNLNDNARSIMYADFNLSVDGGNELFYPYYESRTLVFKAETVKGKALAGISINVIGDNVSLNGITGTDGSCNLKIPSLPPGVYNLKVTGTHTGLKTNIMYVKLNVLKETPSLTFTDITPAYKGGFNTANIIIGLKGKPANNINLRIKCEDNKNGSDYTTVINYSDNKLQTSYEMNFRKVRKDTETIICDVLETDYTEYKRFVIVEPLNTMVISDWSVLKTECENVKGVDYIEIPQVEVKAGEPIKVTRDIDIIGQVGNSWCKFINSTNNYLFKVFNDNMSFVTLYLEGLSFESNKNGVLYADNYSNLDLYYCRFVNNVKSDNIGVCIQNRVDSETGAGKITSTILTDTYFLNNKGSCVASCGSTSIKNSHFFINDWNYSQHPQPYAVEVFYEECSIQNSEFYLNMGLTESPLPNFKVSNFSWGKVPFYVQRNAVLNGKYGRDMLKDNSLNLRSNKSYIYARYNYNGVKVVASPRKNYERKACGHVISGRNWAWKDGVRVEKRNVYDNYINLPSLNVPSSNRR